jgi:hypothetical protein
MASIASYPRVLLLAGPLSDALAARGNDIPAWLPFGWMWAESGGTVGEADYSVASLGGELGLFQLSQDERTRTGFTDTGLMTGKTDDAISYQIRAGLALIDLYGGQVAAAGVDSSQDPLYWMLIKFAHGIGSGAMKQLVQGWIADQGVGSWDDFDAWAFENPYSSTAHTEKWLDQTASIRTNGLALATAAGIAQVIPGGDAGGGAVGVAGIVLVVALAGYLLLGGRS